MAAPTIRIALAVVLAAARAAHADDITLHAALTATAATSAARALDADTTSARIAVDAAGAWPASSVTAGTNRLTARVVVGASVPLPVLGTLGAARREAAAHARVVRAESARAGRELQQRVALAWLALARADADAAALALVVTQASQLEQIAQGRLDAGAGAEVDVTTSRAARARADVDAAAAAREQQAASAALAAALGWDPARVLHAAGPLPTGTATLDVVTSSLAAHPEHVTGREQIAEDEAAEHQHAVARRPVIALDGQVSFSDPETPGTDVFVGLSFELPVFANIGDRVRSAQAHTLADRFRLQATDARLRGEVVASFHRWQAATEKLTALERDVLPAQQRAADLAQQAYREGARELATALLAAHDLAALRSEITAARITAAQAWVELQLASGRSLDAL